MRKIFTSLLVFVFAFFVLSISPVSAKIITDQAGSVVVGKSEVVNDDLFVGAQAVEIAGTINGDVFIGAQTVKVIGIINGNLKLTPVEIPGNQNVLVSAPSPAYRCSVLGD